MISASRYGNIPYGLYKYGSTGTEDTGTYLWAVEVDWDGDGVFDGTNEASRLTDIDITRGRKNFLQPNGQGFYPVQPGNAKLTFDNHDGRYDAWNSSSPLYPNVTYGKDIRIKAIDPTSSSTYSVFYGIVSDIQPYGYGSTAYVKIVAEDGLNFLINNNADSREYLNITPDNAISNILTFSGWETRWGTNLDTSTSLIPSFWCENIQSFAQCQNVANTFLGYFFVAGNGNAKYVDRSESSTASISYNENVLLKDISLPQPWLYYRDRVELYYKNFVFDYISPSTLVWEYFTVGAYREGFQPINAQPNVYNNVFVKNSFIKDRDSSGYPYENFQHNIDFVSTTTSTTSITFELYVSSNITVSSNRIVDSATSTYISTFYYNRTVNGIYLLFIHAYPSTNIYLYTQKLGTPFNIQENKTVYPLGSTEGGRIFKMQTNWIQNSETASNTASLIGAFLATQNKFPVIQVVNRPSYQFPELFDKVTLDVPKLGISTESFRVGGLEHIGTPQDLKTTIWLEKYIST